MTEIRAVQTDQRRWEGISLSPSLQCAVQKQHFKRTRSVPPLHSLHVLLFVQVA